MTDENKCSNCREALCADEKVIAFEGRDVCEYHVAPLAPHHDYTSTPANDLCTRPMKVAVKGCRECSFQVLLTCYHPKAKFTDNVSPTYAMLVYHKHRKCPLLTKGQPNAGILIVAEAPKR